MKPWLLLILLFGAIGWGQGDIATVAFIYPQTPSTIPPNSYFYGVAGESGRRGAVLASEEFGWAAQQEGWEFKVLMTSAPNAASARRAAQRLIANENVFAIIGGFETSQADALSALAEERGVLFFNVGSTDRRSAVDGNTLHVQSSVEAYLKALREVARPAADEAWFVVHAHDEEGGHRLKRARELLLDAKTAPYEAGSAGINPSAPRFVDVMAEIEAREPDAVLLLLDWRLQLEFIGQLESAGDRQPDVWSLPDSVTATREFFGLLRNAAPQHAGGLQLVPWEATLASPDAEALNDRFEAHFGEPMDGPAWASYQAVKFAYEGLVEAAGDSPEAMIEYLTAASTELDADKDEPVAFDRRTRELKQPIYLVRVETMPTAGSLLDKKRSRATLDRVIDVEDVSED